MKIIDAGHSYSLNNLDGECNTILNFVKREGENYPGNIGHHPGTNIQEVLRALIDRIKYVNNQIQDNHNEHCLLYLRHCLRELEERAAERHNRKIPNFLIEIEKMESCLKCGHIGCIGECH